MRHEWIFDVLEDLRSYAVLKGLEDTAAKAEATLQAARLEVRDAPVVQGLVAGQEGRAAPE